VLQSKRAHLHCIAHKHGKRQQEDQVPCQLCIDDLFAHRLMMSNTLPDYMCTLHITRAPSRRCKMMGSELHEGQHCST
jgi:hypothetical protein